MDSDHSVKINWFITGYHAFKFRPEENEEMNLFAEKKNQFDPWAIVVKTKAGKTVGRVPANLCRLLRLLKDVKVASSFKCLFTNNVYRLHNHTKKFEKSSPFDKQGHGVVLSCIYTFKCNSRDVSDIKKYAEANVPEKELQRFEF